MDLWDSFQHIFSHWMTWSNYVSVFLLFFCLLCLCVCIIDCDCKWINGWLCLGNIIIFKSPFSWFLIISIHPHAHVQPEIYLNLMLLILNFAFFNSELKLLVLACHTLDERGEGWCWWMSDSWCGAVGQWRMQNVIP